MGFQVSVSDSAISMVYIISCLLFFGMSAYQMMISLPRLRKAVTITIVSLIVAVQSRNRKCFYGSQRLYDLAVTVPKSFIWTISTLATLIITLGHQSISLDAQLILSAAILPTFVMYVFLDLLDFQESELKDGRLKFKNSRDWL